MSNIAQKRHRAQLYSRVYAQPRRKPELSRLAMIVGISMLLAVLYTGMTSEQLGFMQGLR